MKPTTRKAAALALAAVSLAWLNGCVRDALKDSGLGVREYSETVESVLLAADASKVVFVGQQHHYVFDCPPALARTLNGPFKRAVEAVYSGKAGSFLDVGRDGSLELRLVLRLDQQALTPEQIEASYAAGFSRSRGGLSTVGPMDLKGRRYGAGDFKLPNEVRLNRPYTVRFREAGSLAGQAAEVLLTPVAAAADGVLFIGMVPLGLVTMAYIMVGQTIQDKPR